MPDTLEVTGTLLEVFRSHGIGPDIPRDLDPQAGLIKYIDMAEHEIVFAIYSLASQPILDALKRAHDRGVVLRGIADNKQWSGIKALNEQAVADGIDLERALRQHACMHLKVGVIDGHIVALGSFNWTNNAELKNDEILLVTDSTDLAQVCIDQIDAARLANKAMVREQIVALGTDIRF